MRNAVVMTTKEETESRHNVALYGSETNGQFSLRVQEVAPGEGTPLHIHVEQAETFHVVSGTFRFRVGDKEVIGKPGFTVHIPKGTPHCFLYDGATENGQLISVLTPGINDGFIAEVPVAQENGASNEAQAEIAERFGTQIIGPGLEPTA